MGKEERGEVVIAWSNLTFIGSGESGKVERAAGSVDRVHFMSQIVIKLLHSHHKNEENGYRHE